MTYYDVPTPAPAPVDTKFLNALLDRLHGCAGARSSQAKKTYASLVRMMECGLAELFTATAPATATPPSPLIALILGCVAGSVSTATDRSSVSVCPALFMTSSQASSLAGECTQNTAKSDIRILDLTLWAVAQYWHYVSQPRSPAAAPATVSLQDFLFYGRLPGQFPAQVLVAGTDYRIGDGDTIPALASGFLEHFRELGSVYSGLVRRQNRLFGQAPCGWLSDSEGPGAQWMAFLRDLPIAHTTRMSNLPRLLRPPVKEVEE